MTKLDETIDYDVFIKHKSNRKTDEKLVSKLTNAIQSKNLLSTHPILVDKEFHIIDGQHRLEAARRLGLAVSYIIDETAEVKDMITVNTNVKPWTIVDYLNYYVEQGYSEYLLLNEFINSEKLQLNISLQLLNGCRTSGFFKQFKDGKYMFPTKVEFSDVLQKKFLIKEVIAFIKRRTSGPKTYLDRVTFYGALVDFFNIKAFSYEILMKKLLYKIDLIHPCTKQCEYVSIFREIYNWKNQSPIRLEEQQE